MQVKSPPPATAGAISLPLESSCLIRTLYPDSRETAGSSRMQSLVAANRGIAGASARAPANKTRRIGSSIISMDGIARSESADYNMESHFISSALFATT
jgi:hypothetical protein